MIEQDGKVNILIVDDKPDKVMSLEVVLEDLNQNIVRAYSGRDALRAVLLQEFAVILLDVNMPGMDGFETAELIRQRPATRHVPIIYVTGMGEDIYMNRGYSLGAVDYIHTPVVPEVLKTKVSVFVELAKKSEQISRQAEWLRQRATQLHKLTAASLAINSALSMDRMLRIVTDTAREIIGAHQAYTTMLLDQNWARAEVTASLSDKYDKWRDEPRPIDEHGIQSLVCRMNKTMRMTHWELEQNPVWQGMARAVRGFAPPRGWLAAPLTGRDGRNIGLIEVSDKLDGDFSGDDEAMLVQLAQMASIAIENTIFAEEREANRIKDEFLATLSHELRTPLNAILGWTQLLSTEKLEGDTAHAIQVIERNARAQSKLIEDLLDVSRITTGKFRLNIKPVEFAPIVEAAIDAVRPTAEAKGVRLETAIDGRGVPTAADPDRMQQVVWNLLTNAVKFTPPGGRVGVTIDAPDSERLRLRVSDTGQGINQKFLPYVFDRFRQADSTSTRSHGGLGIGLTIVRHIVEAHNGAVAADSLGEGHGATFTVTLPVARASQRSDQNEPRRNVPVMNALPVRGNGTPDLSGTTVLIVDDQPDAREIVVELLKRAGATVTAAASTDECLECLPQTRPDVLVSDIAMPGRDGYELIRVLRTLPADQGGQTPAIALTAFARDEDRTRALTAGFQLHVPKPVEPVELLDAIAQLAGRSSRSLTLQR